VSKFHRLPIASVERETRDAIAITFAVPDALADQFRFEPGQHLTLRASVGGEDLRRSYSICSAVQDGALRIAVKKSPGGAFSTWANEALAAGATLDVMPPMGHFNVPLDATARRHYLGFAAGSGITPLLSIVKTTLAAEPLSRFTLFYGNRASGTVMFKEELAALKDVYLERFNLAHVLSREAQDIDLLHGRIDRQSERLATLVAQLLDSARLSADSLPLQLEDVDLVALARDIAEEAGPRVKLSADGELRGRWDRARIEQVVSNLLSNALQYSPADSSVELVVAGDCDKAHLEVRDRGVGIPADELPNVFAPFYRSPHSGGQHKGMGLGLHITSEIVHRHGGTIRVESQAGVGSTFVVQLPRSVR